jgi:GT2 family glycosyltransferase
VTTALATELRSEASSAPRAACVVVAFHRPEALARLLDELRGPELEIVVVNVEGDVHVAQIAADCTVLGVASNIGYAAAVNLGTRYASAPFVVFMNDDVVTSRADVLRLVDALEHDADVVVPRVEDAEGRTVCTIAAVPTPSSLAREWMLLPDAPVPGLSKLGVEKWRAPDVPERISAASALLVAAPRTLLLAQPLPEDYFLYWEESEWFWRLARAGARVEYRPEAVCRHSGGREDVRPEKSRLLARNAVRCVRRTQGRWSAACAYVVVIAWNLRLAIVDSVRAGARHDGDTTRVRARWAGVAAAFGAFREIP